jgi:hypothetical protein
MKEVGADTTAVYDFLATIKQKGPKKWKYCIDTTSSKHPEIPKSTFEFAKNTLTIATEGEVHQIASAFLYGREDPIPKMFRSFLANIIDKKLKMPAF